MFSCVPVFGHFLPMVPLADAARRAGHDVVIASGADLRVECEQLGLPFIRVGPSVAESVAAHRPDLSPEERIAADIAGLFVPAAERRAEDLVPLAMHWRPDLIVHEPSELAGAVAAACTGARHAVHGLGLWPAAFWAMLEPGFTRLCRRWRVRSASFLDAVYLDVFPQALQPAGVADFHRVRPIRPVSPPAEEALVDLPDRDAVYLTLGTVFNDAPEVFRTVLEGLVMLPYEVVVTVGPGVDPARIGYWGPQVRVTDFVPQEQVLPRCRVVVNHGGAGSVVGALRHGLPQLVLPRGADNFHNAAAVQSAGAGLFLEPGSVSDDAVADAVTLLLSESGFGSAATKIRAEIEAMPGPDEVLAELLTPR